MTNAVATSTISFHAAIHGQVLHRTGNIAEETHIALAYGIQCQRDRVAFTVKGPRKCRRGIAIGIADGYPLIAGNIDVISQIDGLATEIHRIDQCAIRPLCRAVHQRGKAEQLRRGFKCIRRSALVAYVPTNILIRVCADSIVKRVVGNNKLPIIFVDFLARVLGRVCNSIVITDAITVDRDLVCCRNVHPLRIPFKQCICFIRLHDNGQSFRSGTFDQLHFIKVIEGYIRFYSRHSVLLCPMRFGRSVLKLLVFAEQFPRYPSDAEFLLRAGAVIVRRTSGGLCCQVEAFCICTIAYRLYIFRTIAIAVRN